MGQIIVEQDPKLQKPNIVINLQRTSKDEVGSFYDGNQVEIQQTSVYGIVSPLIQINNVVIDFDKVIDFNLKCTGQLPSVNITVVDEYNLINQFDNPTNDKNELCIQIIPPYDNAYKKINLVFYIDSIRTSRNGYITLNGSYKLPELIRSRIESFGKISTKSLFQTISNNTMLGLASNYSNIGDERYIYCGNESYLDLMNKEIGRGGSELEILDWWIDWWDYLNLVNIYDRFTVHEQDEDMMIWIGGQHQEVTEGIHHIPIKTTATLTNLPNSRGTDLYILEYHINNKSGLNKSSGTDKCLGIYNPIQQDYSDNLIQDGDIQKNIFIKYDYLGEQYGPDNYLIQPILRDAFLQKMSTESIEVVLQTPVLGIMRGSRVNLEWYVNDSDRTRKLNSMMSMGLIDENVVDRKTQYDYDNWDLDQSISGQYLVLGCNLNYTNKRWLYKLILSRPSTERKNILKTE